MIQSKSEKIIIPQEVSKFHHRIIDTSENSTTINDKLRECQQISSKNLCLEKKSSSEYNVGNYLIQQTLGQGTFGKVKLGIYLPNNEKCAIKVLEKSRMNGKDDQIRVKREFDMLSKFNHPNVILVSEIFENINSYFSVMEFCEGGELFNYIVKKKRLSENESSFFYFQLINGLEYIHSLGIVHRDLKPENLLLTKEYLLKIIDFGLSNYFVKGQKDLLSTPCGSPCYTSPEMVAGKKYDGTKIDIWATGIILYAMLCGYLPFEDKDNDILFDKILECNIKYPDFLSSESKDLISKILVVDPEKRIDIPGIKNHSFFLRGKNFFEQIFSIKQISTDDDNLGNNYTNNDKNNGNEKIKEINETNDKNDKNDLKKEKPNDLSTQKNIVKSKNNNSLIENKENINTENININESIILNNIKYDGNILNKKEKNAIIGNLKNRKNTLKCINIRKIKKVKIEELNHKIKLQKDKKSKNTNVKIVQNNEKKENINNKRESNKDMEELTKKNNIKNSFETSSPQRQNKKEKEKEILKNYIVDKNKALDMISKDRNMGSISSLSTSLEPNLKKLKNLGNITNFMVNNINYNVNISLGNNKKNYSPNNIKENIFQNFKNDDFFKNSSNNILHENNISSKNINKIIAYENKTRFDLNYCEANKEENKYGKIGEYNKKRLSKNIKYIRTLDNLEFQKQVLDLNRYKLLINNTHIKKIPKDFISNRILDTNETFKSNNIISYGKKNESSVKKDIQNCYSTSNSIEKDNHFHSNRANYLNTYKNLVINKDNKKNDYKNKNIKKTKKYIKINVNMNNANKLKDKTLNTNKNYYTIENNSKDKVKPLSMKQFNLINKNIINNIKKINKFQYSKLINPHSIEIESNQKISKKEKRIKRTIINSINYLTTNENLSNKKTNKNNKYSLNTLRKQPLINYNFNYSSISPNKTIKNVIQLKKISNNNNQLFNSSSSHPKKIDSVYGYISTNFKMFKPDLFSSIINKKKKKILRRAEKPIKLELTQKTYKSIEVKKDNRDSFFKHDKSKFSFIESLTMKNKKKNSNINGKSSKNNSNLISSKALSNHLNDKISYFNKNGNKSSSKSKRKNSENKNSRKKIMIIYSERERNNEKNKLNKKKFNNIYLKLNDSIKDTKNNSLKKYHIREIARISNINEYREKSFKMRKNKTENNLSYINNLTFQKCQSFHKHLKSFHSFHKKSVNCDNSKLARLCRRNIKQRNKMKKVYLNTKIKDMKNISNEISFTVIKSICAKNNPVLHQRHIISMKNIEHSNKTAHYKKREINISQKI